MDNKLLVTAACILALDVGSAQAQRSTPPSTITPATTAIPPHLPLYQRPDGSFVYPQVDSNGNLYVSTLGTITGSVNVTTTGTITSNATATLTTAFVPQVFPTIAAVTGIEITNESPDTLCVGNASVVYVSNNGTPACVNGTPLPPFSNITLPLATSVNEYWTGPNPGSITGTVSNTGSGTLTGDIIALLGV